jgi:ParB/RepB/Spo0J family partition protein
MDPLRLEELTESMKDAGQVVPIKVRKNGAGYVLVYGHRRVQAAKAAGHKTIEAWVVDVSDDDLLTQSLIENVIREDMAAVDIAKALRLILDETGATQEALGKKLGWGKSNVSEYLGMLDPDLGLDKVRGRELSKNMVHESKAGTGGDLKLAARVLQYAAKEELSTRDTRNVAELVSKAYKFQGEEGVRGTLAMNRGDLLNAAEGMAKKKKTKKEVKEDKPETEFEQLMSAVDNLGAAVKRLETSDVSQKAKDGYVKAARAKLSGIWVRLDKISPHKGATK